MIEETISNKTATPELWRSRLFASLDTSCVWVHLALVGRLRWPATCSRTWLTIVTGSANKTMSKVWHWRNLPLDL